MIFDSNHNNEEYKEDKGVVIENGSWDSRQGRKWTH